MLLLVDLYGGPLHFCMKYAELHLQLLNSTLFRYPTTRSFCSAQNVGRWYRLARLPLVAASVCRHTSCFCESNGWLDWCATFAYSYWTLPLLSVTFCREGSRINETELGCDLTLDLDSHLLV
jgi:hypothetical protein